ncbi:MAG: protein phosphatase CheZ [Cellvibrionaceae bacterium]
MDSNQKINVTQDESHVSSDELRSTEIDHVENSDENYEFSSDLKKYSEKLIGRIQADDYLEASQIILEITKNRDKKIYSAVGQLTRALHEAIINFNIDENNHPEQEEKNATVIDNFEIQDASDRLNYVISLTRKAADKTMDLIEESGPIAEGLGKEAKALKEEWVKLRRREMTKDEFTELYQRIDEFLNHMCSGTEKMNLNMQMILVEQGFQDLTGQVLTKVISLVKDVESELVNLVRMAGQVEEVTGIDPTRRPKEKKVESGAGEGPQIHAKDRDDVMDGQDDVDDLLSSLGF